MLKHLPGYFVRAWDRVRTRTVLQRFLDLRCPFDPAQGDPSDVRIAQPPRQPTADVAEAAVEAIAEAAGQEVPFSLALSQDQKDIRDWVHGFAADVVRPAAHEWDEREETPWPIIQEAAKIGLYGFEGMAQFFADPPGLGLPLVNEELFWGDAGIGMSIMGTALAVAAIFGQGSGEQIGEWIPRCFGTVDDVKVAAFCASEPNAGSDVSGVRTSAKFDEAAGEWVLNGQKAWATNGGISDVHVVIASVDRELGSKGHAAFIVPMSEAKGISQGSKVSKHGLRASHTADVFLDDCRVPAGYVLGGKEKLDERLARVREGKKIQLAGGDGDVRVLAPDGRLTGARHRARSLRVLARVRQGARAVRTQDHREPGDRLHARADEDGDRRGPTAGLARLVDGAQPVPFKNAEGSMSKLKAGEVAVWVTERAIQILGGNGYTREFPVERWHRDAKIYDIFEGTAEIQQLVISRAISGMHIK